MSEKSVDLLESALLDCYGRFIALLPDNVLRDRVHLPFHLQEAFWWYCDKWQVRHPDSLPYLNFAQFLELVCTDCAILRKFVGSDELAGMVGEWRSYARRIPVRGGVLLNLACDRVLLVQSYRSRSWSFPRGKIDEAENDVSCAVREVFEETGLDVSALIREDFYLEFIEGDINLKLFLVPGVDDAQKLKQSSSFEISKFKWVTLKQLENPNFLKIATFQVIPFIKRVLEFAREFQAGKFSAQFPEAYALYRSAVNQRIKQMREINTETFGTLSSFTPEEMFRTNSEKFGVVSTYNENECETMEPLSSWKPVEIKRPKEKKFKERQLIPFNPNEFY